MIIFFCFLAALVVVYRLGPVALWGAMPFYGKAALVVALFVLVFVVGEMLFGDQA